MSYKDIILKVLKDEWIPAYKLDSVNTQRGRLGSSGSRRARELAEAGEIEKKLFGKFIHYRKKPLDNRLPLW